jgi:gliding motility-associated-like protein
LLATVAANVTTYQHINLTEGTTLYYRIKATNSGGDSPYSDEANAKTSTNIPATPTGFAAIASTSGSQINLSWNDVSNETSYVLERKLSTAASFTELATLGANVTSYSDLGLPEGTTYHYRLKAVNATGSSPYTSEQIATTAVSPPAKPTGLAATAISVDQINLTWNDNLSEDSYVLESGPSATGPFTSLATLPANTATYSHTGITEGTTVYYRIKAINIAGQSAYSDIASAATLVSIPVKPTGLTATGISSSEIKITWADNTNEASYVLESSTSSSGPFTQLTTPGKDVISFTHTGIAEGVTIYYRLKAVNASGESEYSDVASGTTNLLPPAAPVTLSASSITESAFTAEWTLSAKATSYILEVSEDNFATLLADYPTTVTGTSQLVSGLTPNKTYKFRVRAANSGGESPNSTPYTVSTLPTPPVANPASVITYQQFSASWSPVANCNYQLDVSTVSDFSTFVPGHQALSLASTSFTVTGLEGNRTYYYRVRSVSLSGAVSVNSNVVAVTTFPVPPIAPVATVGTDVTQTSFMAHWNVVPGATIYQIDVSSNNFLTYESGYDSLETTATFITINNLSPNTNYQYRVRAKNSGGLSPNSNYISVQTFDLIPAIPVAISANNINKNGFTARWRKAARAKSYQLDVATDALFTNLVSGYANLAVTDTTKMISGLTANTSYWYRVRAVNESGASGNSNTINQITLPEVPNQPVALPATNITQTSFTAHWETTAGATSYKLEVSKDNFMTFVPGFGPSTQTGTSVNVTGLTPEVQYQYRIKSVNAGGESVYSNVIDVITLPLIPSAPIAYDATSITQTGFRAHWSKVPGVTSYQFDLSNDNFQTFIPGFNSLTVNDTTVVVSSLANNSQYKYRVRAVKPGVVSPNSNVITVLTLPFPPDAPEATAATDIRKRAFIANWNPVANADRYYIDVSTDNFQTLLPDYSNKVVNGTSLEVIGLVLNTSYQYRVRAENRGGISPNSNIISVTTLPNVAGGPRVTDSETDEDVQSPPNLFVERSLPEDPDIQFFKVTNILYGTLYKNDGVTEIPEGSYITVDEGKAGLRFTPAKDSTLTGSYDVQASSNQSNTGLAGEVATATIKVRPINDPPLLYNLEDEFLQFAQGDNSKVISESISLLDVDDDFLDSAVVRIKFSTYQKDHDFLYFRNTLKIKVKNYDTDSGTLVLTGKATVAEYEEALRNVLFFNDIIGKTDIGLKEVSFKIWDGKAFSEIKTRKIEIADVFVEIEIPTGITPDDISENNIWEIENIELYPDCLVEIYGRNGERLFQSKGYKEKWDGTYNGKELPVGTYYYFIDLREKGKKYKGPIAILR